jgi:RNA polymerase sigma-70 factor (ECF subfamily)
MSNESPQHLSQISTAWTMLVEAHAGAPESAQAARRELLGRYSAPVYRYLLAAVRDADAADELYQEFALRFVRGAFCRAHPDRGRFRDFLKTCLYHLVVDHAKHQRRRPQPLPVEDAAPAVPDMSTADSDRMFLDSWRTELLQHAWQALASVEQTTSQPFHTVLHFRTTHPELQSPQMAEQFTQQLGRPVNAGWVRKWLHLAREKFADLLLEEVLRTLENPTTDRIADELQDLGLLDYCRSALQRHALASQAR